MKPLLLLSLLGPLVAATPSISQGGLPKVTIQNGTIIGTSNGDYNVDSFLGIPYAQPPLGDLRFDLPKPYQSAWAGPKNVTEYGPFCLGHSLGLKGFNQDGIEYQQSEDCLTVNIVRPAGISKNASLPVLVWIPGGGLVDGGSGDARYNLTYLVATSVEMGMPTIVVSLNYRLSGWGYLTTSDLAQAGLSNFGLHDQRMALAWLQENIAAFGGDPARVTISGESAGAYSVGFHLLAYASGNNNSRPFSAAIAQSGGALIPPTGPSLSDYDARYPRLLNATGCLTANNALACLRSAPQETLSEFFNGNTWFVIRDGVTVPKKTPFEAIGSGNFSRVPLLIGATTNEGTTMYDLTGLALNSTGEMGTVIERLSGFNTFTNETFNSLIEQYSALNLTKELGAVSPSPGPSYGAEWGIASLLLSDYMFNAGRRTTCQMWAQYGVPAYSYRFDTIPAGLAPHIYGVAHFQDIPFMFRDTTGVGWNVNPFAVEPQERRKRYEKLAELMSRMWLSFANTLSPNNHGVSSCDTHWPVYANGHPTNFVFDGNETSYVEMDDWRVEPIRIMKENGVGWLIDGVQS
ncbi:putative extracellular lipase [Macrophomina phaseolina]|uniref:Carboxylic ester hydrolase n=1 Tax=Macrophomina phaseolina TaxID=35725 RepID=A0ABQ8G1S3_9PEZI|nr:putative extracellular lipase [Macrophomina phaseolina]